MKVKLGLAVLAAVLLALFVTGAPAWSMSPPNPPELCQDSWEHDDTMATASIYPMNGETQRHTLDDFTDEDWFSLQLVMGTTYTITTFSLTPNTDTVITLYNSSGQQVAENNDYRPWPELGSQIVYRPYATGTFYLKALDFYFRGGCRAYSINVREGWRYHHWLVFMGG